MLKLGFGFSFRDLYSTAGLRRLDAAFVAWLGQADAALAARLAGARADPDTVGRKEESELLIAHAPPVEDFLAQLFGVESEVTALQAAHHELALKGKPPCDPPRRDLALFISPRSASFPILVVAARCETPVHSQGGPK
jgi:hypothetical protein